MKKLISLVLILACFCAFALPASASAIHFPDSEEYPAVEAAAELGIVHGYTDGLFHPLDTMTRAQFMQMVCYAFCGDPYEYGVGPFWWSPAEWFLFEAVLAPLTPDTLGGEHHYTGKEFYSDLCAAYYDYDESWDDRPDDGATYRWIVTMLYLMWCNGGGGEVRSSFDVDAIEWATLRGYGPNSTQWRNISSGEYTTRAEACALFLGLCEIS